MRGSSLGEMSLLLLTASFPISLANDFENNHSISKEKIQTNK